MQSLLAALTVPAAATDPARMTALLAATDAVPLADVMRAVGPMLARPGGWRRLAERTHALHPLCFRITRRLSAATAGRLLEEEAAAEVTDDGNQRQPPPPPLPALLDVTLRHRIVGTDALVELGLSRGDPAFTGAVGALLCRHGPGLCGHYYPPAAGAVLPAWWRRDDHFVVADLAGVLSGRDAARWTAEIAGAVQLFDAQPALRPTLLCLATVRPILGYPSLVKCPGAPLEPHALALAVAAGTVTKQDMVYVAAQVGLTVLTAHLFEPLVWWAVLLMRSGTAPRSVPSGSVTRAVGTALLGASAAARFVWPATQRSEPESVVRAITDLLGDHRRQYPWDLRVVRTLVVSDALPGADCAHPRARGSGRRFRLRTALAPADGGGRLTFSFAEVTTTTTTAGEATAAADKNGEAEPEIMCLAGACPDPACAATNAWVACALRDVYPAFCTAAQAGGGTVALSELPGGAAAAERLLLPRQSGDGGGREDEPLPHIALRLNRAIQRLLPH